MYRILEVTEYPDTVKYIVQQRLFYFWWWNYGTYESFDNALYLYNTLREMDNFKPTSRVIVPMKG